MLLANYFFGRMIMTTVSAWQKPFIELFRDPISHELMQDPATCVPCGHSFEKEQIEGWRAFCVRKGAPPTCPLCRQPIQELITAFLLKQAIEVVCNPQNSSINHFQSLTDEEQEQLQQGASQIEQQQAQNVAAGVPNMLAEPQSFIQRVKAASQRVYGCT